ncbi:DUF5405 family protein [Rahnella sp. GSA61A]|uniref:DUF5405 family protein n=1 Tax=Rahnella sp. GSA61A TaxID=2862678 RepID=UPI001CBCA9DB|nr:DUF5405 family protein [Rahnella sp. GSA61A]
MIRISVGDNWVVTSDCYQFILNKNKTVLSGDKKGQEYLEATAYYAKIDQLVKGLLHFHIRDSDVRTLAELADEIASIGDLCRVAFNVTQSGK